MVLRRSPQLFADEELSDAFEAVEWSATDLGEPAGWPTSLTAVVRMMAEAERPMFAAVGGEFRLVYNATFAEITGPARLSAFGRTVGEVFGEGVESTMESLERVEATDINWEMSAKKSRDAVSMGRLRAHICPIRNADGEAVGVLATDVYVESDEVDEYQKREGTGEEGLGGAEDLKNRLRAVRRSEARYRALLEREAHIEFLHRISEDFSHRADPEAIRTVVSQRLADHLGVCRVTLSEIDESTETVANIYDWSESHLPDATGRYRLDDFLSGEAIDELRGGRPVAVDDVATDGRTADYVDSYRQFGIGSQLLVPYHSGDRWRFQLSISHDKAYQWRDDEIDMMCDLAERLWLRLERARAEEASRVSRKRLLRALTAAKMAVWEWNAKDGDLITFPEPSETEGLPVAGDAMESQLELIHPEDVEDYLLGLKEALYKKEAYSSIYRMRHPETDQWLWVEDTGRGIETDDGRQCIRGAVRNITELRQTERRLEKLSAESERRRRLHAAIMSSIPDLVFVFDTECRIAYANDALLEMWGGSREEVEGRRLGELGCGGRETAQNREAEIKWVMEAKKPHRGEVEFEDSSGERVFDYIMVPVMDDEGGVEAVAGTARDVTGHKRAKQDLEEEASRKNRFMAILSHELRNPLAPIKLGLHILDESEPGSEKERKARETIDRQVDQLTRLVDDLLDVTRITRDKIELQRRRLELNELIRQTVDDHRSLFDTRDVDVFFEPLESPVFVDGDPNRLAQIVGNLLQNAAKFTEPGGGATRVWLDADPDGRVVEMHVADDGMGMDEQILATVFESFAQSDATREHPSGGLGLGLALVKGLVELHGGAVEAHSEGPGRGSEFVVQLPADIDEEHEMKTEGKDTPPRESLEILLIEDNPDVASSLQMVLQMQGHDVSLETDGISGLERARAKCPDVIICDLGLPGIDGYEVARKLSDDGELESTTLVALSGYAQDEDVRRSRDAGFEHHLAKPPDLAKLREILAEIGVELK